MKEEKLSIDYMISYAISFWILLTIKYKWWQNLL